MPKEIPQSELDEIIQIITNHPAIPLGKIYSFLTKISSLRTLQSRLSYLVKTGRLNGVGNARARLYSIPKEKQIYEIPIEKTQEPILLKKETIIPLSPESKKILTIINKPVIARKPVGYHRKFLDDYHPNVTNYLPVSIQQKLLELGKTDGERPAGTHARNVLNRLLIDLSWNSSRLEGNTYSILETERLIELSEAAEGKNFEDTQMILNHKAAIEFLVDSVEEIDVNRQTILNLHALLSENLMKDPDASGRVRTMGVSIGKSVYHPLVVPDVIKECFEQIIDTAYAIKNPFEQAFFLMVHLPYLQPFEDVNKRVSRLAANISFIRLNLAPLSFIDVPRQTYINALLAVYELNRIELLRDVFIWAYERSCDYYSMTVHSLGQPDLFKLHNRIIIKEIVYDVVKQKMDKTSAVAAIKNKAMQSLPMEDHAIFLEKVEIELRSLHEGNIIRFKIKSSEYEEWKKTWR